MLVTFRVVMTLIVFGLAFWVWRLQSELQSLRSEVRAANTATAIIARAHGRRHLAVVALLAGAAVSVGLSDVATKGLSAPPQDDAQRTHEEVPRSPSTVATVNPPPPDSAGQVAGGSDERSSTPAFDVSEPEPPVTTTSSTPPGVPTIEPPGRTVPPSGPPQPALLSGGSTTTTTQPCALLDAEVLTAVEVCL